MTACHCNHNRYILHFPLFPPPFILYSFPSVSCASFSSSPTSVPLSSSSFFSAYFYFFFLLHPPPPYSFSARSSWPLLYHHLYITCLFHMFISHVHIKFTHPYNQFSMLTLVLGHPCWRFRCEVWCHFVVFFWSEVWCHFVVKFGGVISMWSVMWFPGEVWECHFVLKFGCVISMWCYIIS